MDKISLARSMRSEGKCLREIASALDISIATASTWTRGVLPYNRCAPDPRKQGVLPVLERLYREGHPITEIARITGMPQSTLFDWRRELALPKNPRAVYVTDELRRRIARSMSSDPDGAAKEFAAKFYVENQLSMPELAAILRVTSSTISMWLKQAHVTTRTEVLLRTREKLRAANLGARRWNWKGGITPDRIRLRTSLELRASLDMRLAREACFERDDYTCRSCGQRGAKLNAHHVWPSQRFPDWKYEVWNLVTLCKRCHDEFHKAAGGHVRMAIGPFFSKTGEVRESPAAEYCLAA
jgi:transposase-like protein